MTERYLPDAVTDSGSLEEAAVKLGEALELAGPAPLDATRAALADPRYARAIIASRKIVKLRDRLLEAAGAQPSPSPVALAGKAAGSVLKWGMEGLRPAEPWVIRTRLEACGACPFDAPAPDTLVYRGAKVAVGKDARICTSCHCLINTKAAISTEHCPEQDPEDPARSRWGEAWIPPEDHPQGPW